MKIFSPYLKLPKSIYVLFFARIINCIGSFVYPFLTMLLTLKLGFNPETAGLFTTVSVAVGGIGLLIGGRLADRFGRKRIIIILSILSGSCFIICAFLVTSPIIAYLIILANFFSTGQFPAMNAMVTDLTHSENRKNAFSLMYLSANIGIAIGPLIAGFLFTNYLVLIFIIDGLTTFLAMIPIIILVKETLPSREKVEKVDSFSFERAETGNIIAVLFRRPVLLIFAFILMVYFLVYAQYSFGLPIYVTDIFTEGPRFYGMIMTVNATVVVVATLFLVEFMKKIKPIINIGISGILFALGFGMLYYSRIFTLFIISTIIWTLGEIINTVNSNVFIANHSPISHRGRFSAIISFISQAGFAISPILFGKFIQYNNVINIWPLIFFLALLATILTFGLYLFEKNKEKRVSRESLLK